MAKFSSVQFSYVAAYAPLLYFVLKEDLNSALIIMPTPKHDSQSVCRTTHGNCETAAVKWRHSAKRHCCMRNSLPTALALLLLQQLLLLMMMTLTTK